MWARLIRAFGIVKDGLVIQVTPYYNAVGNLTMTFGFSPGFYSILSVSIGSFDGVDFTSLGGGIPIATNAYNTLTAGLAITGLDRAAVLQGSFFGPAPAGPGTVPAHSAGQGTITGPGGYRAYVTYATDGVIP